MPETNLETDVKRNETSAQFRERIEETRRELERQKSVAQPASQPASAQSAQTPEQVNGSSSVAKSQNEPPADPVTRGAIPEIDEWWAKKGFKTPDDIANSYRELERELTRKNLELQRQTTSQQAPPPVTPVAPPAGYPPYYQVPQQQLPYVPANYVPPIPQQTAEQLAEQYGLAPDDFKKVYAIANDLSQVNVQRELNRIMPGIVNQVQRVNGELGRQREMVDLMSEPTWKNPQVQFEMHKVLNDDPTLIQRQPLPYRYAHDEALKRIARANLGGSNVYPTQSINAPASTGARPPVTAGANGKGAAALAGGTNAGEMTTEQFAGLPLAEKTEFLRTLGVLGR